MCKQKEHIRPAKLHTMKNERGGMMDKELGTAPNKALRLRAKVVGALFAVGCFGVLVVQLYRIQFVDRDFYAQKAAGQQLRGITVNAGRGTIYDANLDPLAVSSTAWTIRAVPREMAEEDIPQAAVALAEILQLDQQKVLDILNKRTSNDALLKRQVDKATVDELEEWLAETQTKGILIVEDSKRYYPEGDFAGSILGFVNVDGDGVAGIELEYNDTLTGEDGTLLSAKNAWGYPLPDFYETLLAPQQGSSLVLTIDKNIQGFLENHLARAVEEYHVQQRAVGIVMEVDTGKILAMSTKPDYDPNQPRLITDETLRAQIDALEGEERSQALSLAQQTQWRNKAVSDLYEPGSVFKIVTASAALDSGAVSRNSLFECRGSISVAGTRFRCANGRVHGTLNIADALMNSCNPSFIQIGAALGSERFFQYFEAFGLTGATGIDLPAEPKKSEYYTAERMGPVELASCSFGQSSKITPIQVITAVSAAVNGGKLMQPYLVSAVLDEQGSVLQSIEPTVKRQVISLETSDMMREMLKHTVDSGPGKNAYVAGYRVGGKSGTSQKLDSENKAARIASFVGIAPADDPKIAVLVVLDEPNTYTTAGGTLAAPVVGKVIRDTLQYLEVEPIYTEEEKEKLNVTVPNVVGSNRFDASNELAYSGLNCSTRGNGETVKSQYPPAGETLPRGSTVVMYTEETEAETTVVPVLEGLTPEQAEQVLRTAGLNLNAQGAAEQEQVKAVSQNVQAGTTLPLGSSVTVEFYDTTITED